MRWPFQKWWNFRQTPQFYTTMTGQIGEVADVAESSRTKVWFIDQGHSCCCTSLGVPWKESMDVNQPAFGNARQSKHIGHKDTTTSYAKKKSSNFRTVFLLVVSIQQHAWTTCLAWPRGTLWDQAWSIGSMWSLTAHWRTPHFLDAGLARNGWEYPRHHHLPQELVCQAFVILLVWFFARIRPGLTWNWLKCDAWRDLPQTVASLCSSYHGDGQCCCRLEFEATGIPNGGPAMGVFYCINNTDKYIY